MITADVIIGRLRERGLLDMARTVCLEHHVTLNDVCGRAGTKMVTVARIAIWRNIRKLGLSYPEIGAMWDRNHSTVMDGIKKASRTSDVTEARAAMRVI